MDKDREVTLENLFYGVYTAFKKDEKRERNIMSFCHKSGDLSDARFKMYNVSYNHVYVSNVTNVILLKLCDGRFNIVKYKKSKCHESVVFICTI